MIYIKGFENIIHINSFSLKKNIFEHSICEFECLINSDDIEKFSSKSGETIRIDYDDKTIFCGYIYELSVDNFFSSAFVTVKAYSESKRIDISEEFRIFQDPEKTFEKVLDTVKKDFKITCDNIKEFNEKIVYPVIQDGETNFSFIRRMAHTHNLIMMPDDRSSGKKNITLLSNPENLNINLKYEDLTSYKAIRKYNCVSDDNSFIDILEIGCDRFFDIGTYIDVTTDFRKKFFVSGMEMIKEDEMFLFKYQLIENEKFLDYETESRRVISFEAKVTDNRDPEKLGRIQVEFLTDVYDDKSANKLWIPYKTQYTGKNSGVVFIPDPDDIVNVVFVNDSFIASESLRKEKVDDRFSNQDNKYIANIHNRYISFTDKELELKSGENIIQMTDDEIKLIVTDSIIHISKDKIEVSVGDNSIIFDKSSLKIKVESDVSVNAKNADIKYSNQIDINCKTAKVSSSGVSVGVKTGKLKVE